jgi:serine/threonine protein kinase
MFLIQKNPAKGLSEPGLFSPELNKFIKRCLAHNPEDRPTAKQLLSDPFILGFSRGRVLIDQVERRTTPLEKESAGTIIEHP